MGLSLFDFGNVSNCHVFYLICRWDYGAKCELRCILFGLFGEITALVVLLNSLNGYHKVG